MTKDEDIKNNRGALRDIYFGSADPASGEFIITKNQRLQEPYEFDDNFLGTAHPEHSFQIKLEENCFKKKDVLSGEYVVVKKDFWWTLKSLLNKIGFKFSYKYTVKPKNEQ